MISIDRARIAALLAALVASSAHAQLTVVDDHGGQPARPYYVPISGAHVSEHDGFHARDEAQIRGPVTEADMLPVQSAQLTPGPVAHRAIQLPDRTTPFFLLGTDAMSRRWLTQRGDRLRQLHAVGLVVDVTTPAQLQQLRRLGQGLELRPVAGDDIARRLDLAHYPVLITATGVQQ